MLCPNCHLSLLPKYTSNNQFNILFCQSCLTGFTYPIPKNLNIYYHIYYWISPGILGKIKNFLFKIFQLRRRAWVYRYLTGGQILDVGAGEARFSKLLTNKFQVTSLDPSPKIKNREVIRIDFLKWHTKSKFDAIVFWESLEHTPKPQKYLEKAAKLLKKDGFLFIEYPRFDSWEAKLFKKYWFHLDPPRHLSHLTKPGMEIMLSRAGFLKTHHLTTSAFDYTIWGLIASILNTFHIKTESLKHKVDPFFLILITPLAVLAFFIEVLQRSVNQSPIGLIIAKKN